MAKHEFGIMMNTPQQNERYDEYESQKYDCISINDKRLENVVKSLTSVASYWHTLLAKNKGLAYYGVTLVPPCSLKAFINIIADIPELCERKKLLKRHWSKINGVFITEFD